MNNIIRSYLIDLKAEQATVKSSLHEVWTHYSLLLTHQHYLDSLIRELSAEDLLESMFDVVKLDESLSQR